MLFDGYPGVSIKKGAQGGICRLNVDKVADDIKTVPVEDVE
jgi:hypothetical protein